MKKNIIRTAALAALLLVGSLSASAQQKSYNVPELNPEYQAMAQLVVDNQLADPDAANKNFTKLLWKLAVFIKQCAIHIRKNIFYQLNHKILI